MTDYLQAWQCIGCGKLEAPQTCIGVCRDKKVFLVGKDEHDAALAIHRMVFLQMRFGYSIIPDFAPFV